MQNLTTCSACSNIAPTGTRVCPKCSAVLPSSKGLKAPTSINKLNGNSISIIIFNLVFAIAITLNQSKPNKEDFNEYLTEEIVGYVISHEKVKSVEKERRKLQLRYLISLKLGFLPTYKSYAFLSIYKVPLEGAKEVRYFGFLGLIFPLEDITSLMDSFGKDLVEQLKPENMPGYFAPPPNPDAMLEEEEPDVATGRRQAENNLALLAEGHGMKRYDHHSAPAESYIDKKGDAKDAGGPPKLNKKSPESPRFDYTYFQLEREFLVKLSGSKKVMSVQIAIMTRYDERVVENIKKHEIALRSAIMDSIRMTTEAELAKPDFRRDLAKKIADVMNTLLERLEDFGGVEEVNFTSFIIQ
jgi:flagellar basal body-associated protein FliL